MRTGTRLRLFEFVSGKINCLPNHNSCYRFVDNFQTTELCIKMTLPAMLSSLPTLKLGQYRGIKLKLEKVYFSNKILHKQNGSSSSITILLAT